ncbi:MarR family transcriptional regulator [Acerihabitans arboris]|uniref:MarR family transcriptional regulator n=1 Tax=Acerihabitans arboris TaxID=2691583 RepID=A0A845SU99_9GAMM|nr:MarR family transcriptional regulator [Acerihabitans arboris]NDL64595.1 MarR family transcriptional regulator [Acerihabitans arboris]
MTESVAMSRLANDGPATTAALARAEGMKPQSMGTTITPLEDLGIVKRTPHAARHRRPPDACRADAAGCPATQKDREAKRMWLSQAIVVLIGSFMTRLDSTLVNIPLSAFGAATLLPLRAQRAA